jgi:uncharacterized protein (DUF488 family)
MIIYTIGFVKKSARDFFEILQSCGAKHLIDIRLNNKSQLAGFTKKSDLEYFLKTILNVKYHHALEFAPEKTILDEYKKSKNWANYEGKYLDLLKRRQAEKSIDLHLLKDGIVLLCSEAKAQQCHRRLAAEYLSRAIPGIEIKHL